MTIEEAKLEFKDSFIKEQGYHSDNKTQFLYKSEVNKKKTIICLFDGIPHQLMENIKVNMKKHFENKSLTLPEGIEFNADKELYRVSDKYFLDKSTDYMPSNPIVFNQTTSNEINSEDLIKKFQTCLVIKPNYHEQYNLLRQTQTQYLLNETLVRLLRKALTSRNKETMQLVVEFLKIKQGEL